MCLETKKQDITCYKLLYTVFIWRHIQQSGKGIGAFASKRGQKLRTFLLQYEAKRNEFLNRPLHLARAIRSTCMRHFGRTRQVPFHEHVVQVTRVRIQYRFLFPAYEFRLPALFLHVPEQVSDAMVLEQVRPIGVRSGDNPAFVSFPGQTVRVKKKGADGG